MSELTEMVVSQIDADKWDECWREIEALVVADAVMDKDGWYRAISLNMSKSVVTTDSSVYKFEISAKESTSGKAVIVSIPMSHTPVNGV